MSFTREQLDAYIDDALSDAETAAIEQALRESAELRDLLQAVRQHRDRGEHTIGAIWRREQLSCLSREELNQYDHELLDPEFHKFVSFHLEVIGCAICLANLEDLRHKRNVTPAQQQRRRRILDSSAGLLPPQES